MNENKIKKKDAVLNLLSEEELTSPEVSIRLNINSGIVQVYLNRLFKEGKVERITAKKPYKYKKAPTSIELLTFMNELFKNNIEYLMKNPEIDKFIEQNENTFNKIEEMIVNAKPD